MEGGTAEEERKLSYLTGTPQRLLENPAGFVIDVIHEGQEARICGCHSWQSCRGALGSDSMQSLPPWDAPL